MGTETHERNWTEVGEEYVERLGRDDVEKTAARMDWQDVPSEGALEMAAMPGYAVNAAIREFDLPKVTAVAVSSFSRPGNHEEDGFYPGFYGIEANYKNGRARIFVLDTGTVLTPLFSDFYTAEAMAA